MPTPSSEYTVVARRYRPQTFGELIGQEHVARALEQAISTDRVGHAYLFTGARGVGKTSAARVLAKALNCADGPVPTPCNSCDICQSVARGDDVDVLEIDGASNRGIDEIRQLRQNVAVRPSRARFKIYIIDEVHMLTKEAFNALLKTLEEPPEHVKFIFATTEPNKIPITILSRCQRFDFAGIDSTSIQQRLTQIAEAEGVAIESAAVQILASRAAGSMRDSQSLLEQLLAVADGTVTEQHVNTLLGIAPAERLTQLVAFLAQRQAQAALAELDGALASGVEVGQLLDQLVGYFRDVMAACVGAPSEQFRHALPSQAISVTNTASQLGVETVLAMLQILDQTAARLRISVHARTLVEMAIVRICHLQDLDELAGVVEKLRADTPAATSGPASKSAAQPASTAKKSNRTTAGPDSQVEPENIERDPAGSPAVLPVAASAADLTPADAQTLWEKVTNEVGGLVTGFAAMTDTVVVQPNGELVVQFGPGATYAKEQCERPATKSQLEKVAESLCGPGIKLRFECAHAPPSESSDLAPAARPNRRQRQAEVAQHAFVARALELFSIEPGQYRYTPPEG